MLVDFIRSSDGEEPYRISPDFTTGDRMPTTDDYINMHCMHDLSRKATFCTDSRRQKDDASAAIVKHTLREISEWSGVKLVGNQQQMANLQLIDHREGESQRQQLASSVQHRHTKGKNPMCVALSIIGDPKHKQKFAC
jgi:hypothetical protein